MAEKNNAPRGAESLSTRIGYEETTPDHKEKVVMFKQKSAKLEKLLSQLPNKEGVKTASVLNAILREKGFGGNNANQDSFAYFIDSQNGPVLVLNTVVNGGKNSRLGDIDTLLEHIRVALEEWKAIDRSNPTAIRLHLYSKVTAVYESNLNDAEQGYQKDTNDLFRAVDQIKGVFSDDTWRKIYERINKSTRNNAKETYARFLKDFSEHPPKTEQEIRSFVMIDNRFKAVMKHEFDGGKTTTMDVLEFLWERKGEMGKDALRGLKGEALGLGMSVFGIFLVFIAAIWGSYNLITEQKSRDEFFWQTLPKLGNSIKTLVSYIGKNGTKPDVLFQDLGGALQEKFTEIQKLPRDQQAEAIGYLAGEIIGMLEGGILMKGVLKSRIFRIKFTGSIAERLPIGKVKNWLDMDKYIESIGRIRFREGWDSAKLSQVISDVRLGKAKLSEIPDVWGIRGKVKELITSGGNLAEKPAGKLERLAGKTKVTDKAFQATKEAGKKVANVALEQLENTQKKLSIAFEKGANGKVLAAYDAFDTALTKALDIVGKGTGKIKAPFLGLSKELDALKKVVSEVDFPKKKEVQLLLANLEKQIAEKTAPTREFLTKERHIFWSGTESADAILKKQLTKKQLAGMTFKDGIIDVPTMENGVKKFEIYNHQGKLIGGKRFEKVFEVRNGVAFVEDNGGLGILKMNGEWEVPPQKGVFQIQRMKNEAKSWYILGFKDEAGNTHFRFSENGKFDAGSRKYDFFAGLDEGMGVVTTSSEKSGKVSKFLLNVNDGKPISLALPTQLQKDVAYMKKYGNIWIHVDNFTKEWVAAVRLPDGNWSIMNKNAEYVWAETKKGAGIKTASSELEALEQFYREKNLGGYKHTPDSWGAKLSAHETTSLSKELLEQCGWVENLRHTGIKDFYSFTTKEGKEAIINVKNGKILANDGSHLHLSDAEYGFVRFNKDGRWGVKDLEGNTLVDAKHKSLGILDEKKGIFEVTGENNMKWVLNLQDRSKLALSVQYDYISKLDNGLYEGVRYKANSFKRMSTGIADFRAKAVNSVGGRSDNITKLALASEAQKIKPQTLHESLELYSNPKIRAYMQGDVSQIFSLFNFEKYKGELESCFRPLKPVKLFKTVQHALAEELSKEVSSSKVLGELRKLLSIRATEVAAAIKDQLKLFPKDARVYSFDTISSNLQSIG